MPAEGVKDPVNNVLLAAMRQVFVRLDSAAPRLDAAASMK